MKMIMSSRQRKIITRVIGWNVRRILLRTSDWHYGRYNVHDVDFKIDPSELGIYIKRARRRIPLIKPALCHWRSVQKRQWKRPLISRLLEMTFLQSLQCIEPFLERLETKDKNWFGFLCKLFLKLMIFFIYTIIIIWI